jgi:Zn-dependent protease with chaperone function
MTLPYVPRLFCVSMAAFFLLHLALGLAAAAAAPLAIRIASRMSPRSAARLLLMLRLFPSGIALFAVAALCIPSYCWLEPEVAAESVGLPCLAAALLGVAVCGMALARACRAAGRSLRYVRQCQLAGRRARLAGHGSDVWLVETPAPVLALARIFRPRLLISSNVVSALSEDELGVVLRHERAHGASRDNAKRLALLLAPGLLPFLSGFGAIESQWAKFAEWAADDRAVAGNSLRSVSLAAALVRVARMRMAVPSPLLSSFADCGELPERVDRLLRTPHCEPPELRTASCIAGTAMLACAAAVMLQPGTFVSVYLLMERLVQ